MIKDIVRKLLFDKQELTIQERQELLLYFELSELDSNVKIYETEYSIINSTRIVVDLTGNIDGVSNHFDLPTKAKEVVEVDCNLLQQPGAVLMDEDMLGFSLAFVPTSRDKLVVRYQS